jgi:arabinogalactan endo-1,4-beta-galactosidase
MRKGGQEVKNRIVSISLAVALILSVGLVGCGGEETPETIEYNLTISSTGGGSVTTPGEGTFTYSAGTIVNLVASPDNGYQFVNWTGSTSTIVNVFAASTTITMNGNYSIKANFERGDFYIVGGTAYDWLWMKRQGFAWAEVDPLQTLKDNGMDWNRVGVLIGPGPIGFPPSWCSIEYAEQVMKSSVEAGMRLDLFFYLSDTVAYWGRQPCPTEWGNFTIEEKTEALREHCYNTTKYYKDKGFNIEIYEIGNEIDVGLCGEVAPEDKRADEDIEWLRENIWSKEAQMLKGAIAGVKQADPAATILLHMANSFGAQPANFFGYMLESGVPFDIAGLSFYPSSAWPTFPGGSLYTITNLQHCIEEIATRGKKVMICEFAYTSSKNPAFPYYDQPVAGYPITPEGQAQYVAYFLRWCYSTPNVVGAIYFAPDNISPETDPEHCGDNAHFSLFFGDTTPKPALNEFKKFRDEITALS